MACADKADKILLCSEVIIQFVQIPSPIPVIPSISVVNDRSNPNGIKTHAKYVIEVVGESLIASSAVVA